MEAANKHHGPWPYKLFLGVLLAICEQETGFRNVRAGGNVEWPGTANSQPPSSVNQPASYRQFINNFANDPRFGRTNHISAVGPMQLYSPSYKDYADQQAGLSNDELGGGRWQPRFNIIGGAFALRDKLKGSGAEATLGRGGSADALIWEGVADYGHLFPGETVRSPRGRYAREVRERYEGTYSEMVESAVEMARDRSAPGGDTELPGGTLEVTGSTAELRERVLNNRRIEFRSNAVRDDVRFGFVDNKILKFLLAFSEAGFTSYIWVFKTGHNKFVAGTNRISRHWYGLAVDIGNYDISRPAEAERAQQWIINNRVALGYSQLIGPIDSLVHPFGAFDGPTLSGHDNHLHIGY